MNIAFQPPETETIQDFMSRVDYRLAESAADREEIYRLRYRAYLREGAVAPSESGITTDDFENYANNWIFGVYVDDELSSSIRISVLTKKWRKSPSAKLYADVLDPLLDAGETIIDPTRFVADHEKSKRYPKLPLVTTRLAIVASEHFKADLCLSICRPEHGPFYRRFYYNVALAEPRLFPGLVKPTALFGARCKEIRSKLFDRSPFLHSSAFERRMLFQDSAARLQMQVE